VHKTAFRFALWTAAILLTLSLASADSYVSILHFNDLHGYLHPVDEADSSVGGLARIATIADEVRTWNSTHGNDTLLIEAGDILQGTPLSIIYQGEPDVLCLNLMDLDIMCVGNHEFDFGLDNYLCLSALAQFPILSANIYVQETGERFAQPYLRFSLADGTQAAALGLTTQETAVATLPQNVAGLEFTDPIAECRSLLAELLPEADFIIAVTHLGYEQDLRLAQAAPDLDVIIGGHSHTLVEPPTRVGKTLVCQAGSYGRYVGQLDMLVRAGDVVKHRGFLRPVDEQIPAHPGVQAIIDTYRGRVEQRLQEVVAYSSVDLEGGREAVRSRETNLGNLICDLFRAYTRADVCVVNGGGIRASIPAGPITVGALLKTLPFSNLVATKKIDGEQLWETLEFAASLRRPAGGFLQVSGLAVVIEDATLKAVTVGGEPLRRDRTYTLATSEFLLSGGDGYSVLTEGAEPVYLGYTDNAIVTHMLREQGTVSPKVEGRITIK